MSSRCTHHSLPEPTTKSPLDCLRYKYLYVHCGCHTAAPWEPSGLICRALQRLQIIIIYHSRVQKCLVCFNQSQHFVFSSWKYPNGANFQEIPPITNKCVATTLSTDVTEIDLKAHNWQKWKRVFPTCPCLKIYRDEAVSLTSCKYTWKLRFLWKCEIWGNIVKIWYFVNNCLI